MPKRTNEVTASATPAAATAPKEKAPKVKAPKSAVAAAAPVSAPEIKLEVEVSTASAEETVAASTASTSASEATVQNYEEQKTAFDKILKTVTEEIAKLRTQYKTLEKSFARALKEADKKSSKKKRKAGKERAPSGFVKPAKISDELATFLGKEKGSEMARTAVTKELNAYIKAHNLSDKENGRKINPDKKLASLLKLGKGDELTYFNLQKFMSPHFAKSEKKVVEAAAGATATASAARA